MKYRKISLDFDGGYRQGLDCALELIVKSDSKEEAEELIKKELKKC